MELVLIKEHITQNYNITSIIAIRKTSQGSGNTFYIDTQSEKYIVKFNDVGLSNMLESVDMEELLGRKIFERTHGTVIAATLVGS